MKKVVAINHIPKEVLDSHFLPPSHGSSEMMRAAVFRSLSEKLELSAPSDTCHNPFFVDCKFEHVPPATFLRPMTVITTKLDEGNMVIIFQNLYFGSSSNSYRRYQNYTKYKKLCCSGLLKFFRSP